MDDCDFYPDTLATVEQARDYFAGYPMGSFTEWVEFVNQKAVWDASTIEDIYQGTAAFRCLASKNGMYRCRN